MPQISKPYAVGRVRALERTMISTATLERMIQAETPEEVARLLSEMEWGEAKDKRDVERLADEHVRAACLLVRESSADIDVTDCFLLKYDFLNLKILIKSRVLAEDAPALSDCGTIDSELLRRCVEENNYNALTTEFREVCQRVEKRIAVEMDPLYVDAEFDKALSSMIARRAKRVKDEPLKAYFAASADLTNLIIALRCAQMNRGGALAKSLFVEGGSLNFDALSRVADEPDRALDVAGAKPYYGHVKQALLAGGSRERIAAMEKARDDYLISLIRFHRYEPTSILPLAGYLLAREREAAAARLIVTAKAAHISEESLRARVKALY